MYVWTGKNGSALGATTWQAVGEQRLATRRSMEVEVGVAPSVAESTALHPQQFSNTFSAPTWTLNVPVLDPCSHRCVRGVPNPRARACFLQVLCTSQNRAEEQ